jgi:hypothetical protein
MLAAATPVRTPMPSRPNTSSISAPDSGSSAGSSWPSASTTVTADPKRENTWASSAPIAPPPRTISDRGTCSVSIAWWLVQYGVPARPGIGGIAGVVPVPMMIPRRARRTSPPTVTSPGAVILPWPRKSWPPLPVNRSAATVSSQSSVASSLIRRATGDQSGATVADPAMPGIRRPSASRLAARIIILDGTQPQYGHSPPTSLASTPATASPASASRPAACSPPGPMPMTMTSTSCSLMPASRRVR